MTSDKAEYYGTLRMSLFGDEHQSSVEAEYWLGANTKPKDLFYLAIESSARAFLSQPNCGCPACQSKKTVAESVVAIFESAKRDLNGEKRN